MKIFIIGAGRWGSLIAYYLDTLKHDVTLYGPADTEHMKQFLATRKNNLLTLPESVSLSTDISDAKDADVILISVPSQVLRTVAKELSELNLGKRIYVLCMKGIEIASGKRLSEVMTEYISPDSSVAVWIGPGHVQEFYRGIPNCMVIDSANEKTKETLIKAFTGPLIRFYYGQDLVGNEIGAAAKNVIGIAAGVLDGLGLSSLKGALMSRGTREVARLIKAMGGNELSAYGLCHLGDYEATVFSQYSHNRAFGEAFAKGERFDETKLAEGYYTADAMHRLSKKYGVELPIAEAVYSMLYENADPATALRSLFDRSLKKEF